MGSNPTPQTTIFYLMRYQVKCLVCNEEMLDVQVQEILGIEASAVACHTLFPHAKHKLAFTIDGQPLLGDMGQVEVLVKCLQPRCIIAETRATVDRIYVNSVVLAHHAAHEGHPLELWVDGKLIVASPVKPET